MLTDKIAMGFNSNLRFFLSFQESGEMSYETLGLFFCNLKNRKKAYQEMMRMWGFSFWNYSHNHNTIQSFERRPLTCYYCWKNLMHSESTLQVVNKEFGIKLMDGLHCCRNGVERVHAHKPYYLCCPSCQKINTWRKIISSKNRS
jgi:hypothetical protein